MTPAPPTPPPPPAPAAGTPPPPATRRSAQVALAAFLAVMLGLLAFRGYGARLGSTEAVTTRFDLNRIDRAELEQIPGVGPKMALAIEAHRQEKGPFRSVDELRDVKGVGPVTLDKLRPFLRVEPARVPAVGVSLPDLDPPVYERKPSVPVARAQAPEPAPAIAVRPPGSRKLQPGDPPVNVNTATAEQLQTLPGIGAVTAQAIISARAVKPFQSVADLDRVRGIGAKTLAKLQPFVVVE